jgi:hypothetical protein
VTCDYVATVIDAEQVSCATGLCNVSASPSSRRAMVDMGCIPILIALGRSNPLEASKQDCARALCNLACEVCVCGCVCVWVCVL